MIHARYQSFASAAVPPVAHKVVVALVALRVEDATSRRDGAKPKPTGYVSNTSESRLVADMPAQELHFQPALVWPGTVYTRVVPTQFRVGGEVGCAYALKKYRTSLLLSDAKIADDPHEQGV